MAALAMPPSAPMAGRSCSPALTANRAACGRPGPWRLGRPVPPPLSVRQPQPQSEPLALKGGALLMAFLPDGKRLLTVGEKAQREVHVWEVATRKRLDLAFTHDSPIVCLAVSGDGFRLATACRDHTV